MFHHVFRRNFVCFHSRHTSSWAMKLNGRAAKKRSTLAGTLRYWDRIPRVHLSLFRFSFVFQFQDGICVLHAKQIFWWWVARIYVRISGSIIYSQNNASYFSFPRGFWIYILIILCILTIGLEFMLMSVVKSIPKTSSRSPNLYRAP